MEAVKAPTASKTAIASGEIPTNITQTNIPLGPSSNPNAPISLFCAAQGETCNVGNSIYSVNFVSANGKTITKQDVQKSIPCTIAAFGNQDPDPGVAKNCYVSADPSSALLGEYPSVSKLLTAPNSYFPCAAENGTCKVEGYPIPNTAVFGVPYSWVSNTVSADFTCNTAAFNGIDPAPNNTKMCYLGYQLSAQPPPITVSASTTPTASTTPAVATATVSSSDTTYYMIILFVVIIAISIAVFLIPGSKKTPSTTPAANKPAPHRRHHYHREIIKEW